MPSRTYIVVQVNAHYAVALATSADAAPYSLNLDTNTVVENANNHSWAPSDTLEAVDWTSNPRQDGTPRNSHGNWKDVLSDADKDALRLVAANRATLVRLTHAARRSKITAFLHQWKGDVRRGLRKVYIFSKLHPIPEPVGSQSFIGDLQRPRGPLLEGQRLEVEVAEIPTELFHGNNYVLPWELSAQPLGHPNRKQGVPWFYPLTVDLADRCVPDPFFPRMTQGHLVMQAERQRDLFESTGRYVEARATFFQRLASGPASYELTGTPWQLRITLPEVQGAEKVRARATTWKKDVVLEMGSRENDYCSAQWILSAVVRGQSGALSATITLVEGTKTREIRRKLPNLYAAFNDPASVAAVPPRTSTCAVVVPPGDSCPTSPVTAVASLLTGMNMDTEESTDDTPDVAGSKRRASEDHLSKADENIPIVDDAPDASQAPDLRSSRATEEKTIFVRPAPGRTGFEHWIEVMGTPELTRTVTEHSHRASIIRQLLAAESAKKISANHQFRTTAGTTLNQALRDAAFFTFLDPQCRTLFVQAPAGSGKTLLMAQLVREFRACHPNYRMLLVAPTNEATLNIVAAIREHADLAEGEMTVLQSLSAETHYVRKLGTQDVWYSLHRVHAGATQLLQEPLSAQNRQILENYANRRDALGSRGYRETDVTSMVVCHERTKVVVSTSSMAEINMMALKGFTQVLMVDEAGQIPFATLIALLLSLRNVEKLFLTGDKRQLPAYTHLLTGDVIMGGLESTINVVDRRRTVIQKTLNVAYRSHPALQEVISAMYDEPLRSGLKPDARTMAASFPFPRPGIPLAVIDCRAADEKSPSGSRTNPEQQAIAEALVIACRSWMPAARIVVVCYYEATTEQLMARNPPAEVINVDSFQGQEAHVTVVVTTKSKAGEPDRPMAGRRAHQARANNSFLLSDERAVVSLTRPKEALFVIGDLSYLADSRAWRRFLREAERRTDFVKPEYAERVRDLPPGSAPMDMVPLHALPPRRH